MLGGASSVAADSAVVNERCTRQFAPSAALKQRFPSFPEVIGRSTAAIASAQCAVSLQVVNGTGPEG